MANDLTWIQNVSTFEKIILKLYHPLSEKIMWEKLVFLSHILGLILYVNILVKLALSLEYI